MSAPSEAPAGRPDTSGHRPGRLIYLLPLALFLVLAGYFLAGLGKDPSYVPSVLIDRPVPEFSLAPLEGRTNGLSSADLKGEVSLVNVFGSWCIACRAEHPFLMQLKDKDAIPIYGIDWREHDRTSGPAWLTRFGDPYTRIGDDPRSDAAIALGVTGAPETFVIDAHGVIRFKQTGPLTPEVWEQTLWPLVQSLRDE